MGDNLKIVTLEKDLVDLLNKCKLPIMVKDMVLKNVYNSVHELTEQKLQEETEEFMRSQEETKGEE